MTSAILGQAPRVGDQLTPHGKPKHPPHPRTIVSGSSTVIINGKPAAITGGSISCGGVTIGSGSVSIGDKHGSDAGTDDLINANTTAPMLPHGSLLSAQTSPGLQQKLNYAGLTLEQISAISVDVLTTNAAGELILKTVVASDSINVNPDAVLTRDI